MDPRKLKVNELKEQLQLAGLSVNGKKEELIARLLEHQKAEEEALNAVAPPTGSGESFDWDESKFDVDDLPPPPSDPVTPATATTITVKKATVDRHSSIKTSGSTSTVTTTLAKSTTIEATAVGSVQFQETVNKPDVLRAELEKRRNRAARFGIPLQEQDRAIERAARFGVPVTASVTAPLAQASGTTSTTTPLKPIPTKPGSASAQIPAEVLDRRRERFGIQAPETKSSSSSGTSSANSALDAAEEEKKRKRAAKFGLTASEDSNKKLKI